MAANSRVEDSITQAPPEVLADSPAMIMGELFQAASQALSNAFNNARIV